MGEIPSKHEGIWLEMACLMLTKPFKWSQLGGAKTRLGCSSLRFIYEILTSTTTVKCVYIYMWDVTQLTIRNSCIPSLQCEPHNVEPKYLHLRHWSGHGGSSFCGHSHTPHFLRRLEKTMSQSLPISVVSCCIHFVPTLRWFTLPFLLVESPFWLLDAAIPRTSHR